MWKYLPITTPLLYRQAEVTRLREELSALNLKMVSQQEHDVKNTPKTSAANDNKSDNNRILSVMSKADIHSGSSHHATSASTTPQVFLFIIASVILLYTS